MFAARLAKTAAAGARRQLVSSRFAFAQRTPFAAAAAASPNVENVLKQRITELVPEKRAEMKTFAQEYGAADLGSYTVGQAAGGMRGMIGLLWDTSLLDAEEGIRFRGHTIEELQAKLPVGKEHTTAEARAGGEPLPEGQLWLLMTGEMPTQEQADAVTRELQARATLPAHVEPMIRSFPKTMHPMAQFSAAMAACSTDSAFSAAYMAGQHKTTLWEPMMDDVITLIARLPRVAALIYRCTFHDGVVPEDDHSLDYAANFNRLLGFGSGGRDASGAMVHDNNDFDELMRMYLTIHADHEGGNVSAHATRLCGSALSDAYLAYSSCLNGLAGPLHGLANQEVLRWTLNFQKALADAGKEVTHETVKESAWATLNSGNVIPGFGHAVLRKTDPRYTVQRAFAQKRMPDDPLFKLVSTLFEVIPGVLTEHGKTKNPWPNVDAHSGCLLMKYNFTENSFYTVLFGVSRAFGVLSQLVWDRALGFPIERPKSVTTDWVRQNCKKQA